MRDEAHESMVHLSLCVDTEASIVLSFYRNSCHMKNELSCPQLLHRSSPVESRLPHLSQYSESTSAEHSIQHLQNSHMQILKGLYTAHKILMSTSKIVPPIPISSKNDDPLEEMSIVLVSPTRVLLGRGSELNVSLTRMILPVSLPSYPSLSDSDSVIGSSVVSVLTESSWSLLTKSAAWEQIMKVYKC